MLAAASLMLQPHVLLLCCACMPLVACWRQEAPDLWLYAQDVLVSR